MARILIAEDDAEVRKWLGEALALEGHAVSAAADGDEALRLAETVRPELLILDVTMPCKNGLEVCRSIRVRDRSLPILFLSARDTEDDKLSGFEVGADDYVTKPFSLRELTARISALLRRSRSADETGELRLGNIVFSPRKMTLIGPNGERTALTEKETALLSTLVANRDKVISRDRLLNGIWGITYYGTTRTLDQHIAMLRRKLTGAAVRIVSVRNIGYKLEVVSA